ncbi:MAG TPA: efflux RND transporter periplasmic adaptor subunit [Terriglobales bacterium]|nr:efflux RND transporter periplasmic adaptor subunit [Terriglobales bacterium]
MKKKQVAAFTVVLLSAFIAGRFTARKGQEGPKAARRILYYVDPMHPAYRSNKPGIAPDCGMALVPVHEGDETSTDAQAVPGTVAIGPEKQQLIGLRVETIGNNSGSRTIRTIGRVEADETRVHRVMAGTEGWVQSVENNPAGTFVKQNQLLATLYSKEFRNAEQAYISSVISLERVKGVRDSSDPNRNDANIRLNEEQLRALGMGEPQIKELAKTRQVTRDVAISSPMDGTVLARSIAPGQRVENGTEFYRIADLSHVWIMADLFGEQNKLPAPGTRVKVTVRELGKTVSAVVSHDAPLFDPESRTLKLRLEADNPGLSLRPDMFVDLEFIARAPTGISVPQEAVLDSGSSKIAYVETSEGVFEPRPVETGPAYGNRVVVTRGLASGDRVVVSGNFLLDSESRLRASALVDPKLVRDDSPAKNASETLGSAAQPARNTRRGND